MSNSNQEQIRKFNAERDRKQSLGNAGLNAMANTGKRGQNGRNGHIRSNTIGGAGNNRSFPTDAEIDAFQSQLNESSIKLLATTFKNNFTTLKHKVKLPQFQKFLNEQFSEQPPAPILVQALWERFKPFRLEGHKDQCHVVNESGMDCLDFLLAMNFLARIVYDKKLKLIFELCDDDDDGCMTSEDILSMLQRVERVFSKESARVLLDSSVLDNFVADKKAEHNFHFIMGMIKRQNLQKKKDLKNQNKKSKDNKEDGDNSGKEEDEEENLITYREFIKAIKNLKSLYKRILPPTLSFKDVLMCKKTEGEYTVTDCHADDFALFRYEINSIFKIHQFLDETPSDLIMGRNPLSKTAKGELIKDLHDSEKSTQQYQEIYRPPGIVKIRESRDVNEESKLAYASTQGGKFPSMYHNSQAPALGNSNIQDKEREIKDRTERYIWNCIPDKKLFHRENYESKYMTEIALKKAEKWEKASASLNQILKQNGGSATKIDDKKIEASKTKKSESTLVESRSISKKGSTISKKEDSNHRTRQELDDLYKVRLDYLEPNTLDLTKMYQDNVPPEAKILEDFLNNQKKDKDSKDSVNIEDVKRKMKVNQQRMDFLFPADSMDWKEISALQFQQFEQENSKYGKQPNDNN